MEAAIKVEDLSFNYGTNSVLKDISTAIKNGSFVSILGPNGSGKTTILKNICSILKPKKGVVLVNNKDVRMMTPKKIAKIMAVVHQGNECDFDFTVHDIVLMGRFPYQKRFKSETQEDLDIVEEAMRATQVWNFREKSIYGISGGERQRVMIARALAQQPRILLLDEPVSQLDIKHQINIMNICKDLNKDSGITIVTTLHDINLAARYSDSIILMKDGEISAVGTPETVLTSSNIKMVYDVDVEVHNITSSAIPYIIPTFDNLG